MKHWTDHQLAFVIARITIGINFLLHGVVRLPKMEGFASGLSKGFEGTMLPPALVEPIRFWTTYCRACTWHLINYRV